MFWIFVWGVLLFLAYFTLVKPFNYWGKIGVPQQQFWNIWIDFILGLLQYRNISERIQKVYNHFPDTRYYGIYQFFGPTLVVRDPDLIKQITVKDFDHFVDHSNFIPNDSDPLWDNNLFFLKREEWKSMRAIVSPSFTVSKMKIMFGLISKCAQQFVQYFQEQRLITINVEIRDIFTKFTNDAIAATAFGITSDCMRYKNSELYLMGKKATTFGGGVWDNLKLYFSLSFPLLSRILGMKIIKQDASNFFQNVIKDNIRTREDDGIARPDVIHLLLEAKNSRPMHNKFAKNLDAVKSAIENNNNWQKRQITDEDIAAQAVFFLLAGFDSIATLMEFTAYEIALNSDIQRRLQEEVDEIRNNCGDLLKYEDISKMKYMVTEALRKWPGPILLHRICVKPYTIQPIKEGERPIHLKQGDIVWLPLFAIHRDPQYYPKPDCFDPERFSKEENKCRINPYLYIPFGVGPRICIGKRFAVMETKILFFHLLSKFDIVAIHKTPIPLKLEQKLFQLEAEGGLWLGLKPRIV